MICCECRGEIGDGEPAALVYIVVREGRRERSSFTGVTWHPACVPSTEQGRDRSKQQIASDAERMLGRAGRQETE